MGKSSAKRAKPETRSLEQHELDAIADQSRATLWEIESDHEWSEVVRQGGFGLRHGIAAKALLTLAQLIGPLGAFTIPRWRPGLPPIPIANDENWRILVKQIGQATAQLWIDFTGHPLHPGPGGVVEDFPWHERDGVVSQFLQSNDGPLALPGLRLLQLAVNSLPRVLVEEHHPDELRLRAWLANDRVAGKFVAHWPQAIEDAKSWRIHIPPAWEVLVAQFDRVFPNTFNTFNAYDNRPHVTETQLFEYLKRQHDIDQEQAEQLSLTELVRLLQAAAGRAARRITTDIAKAQVVFDGEALDVQSGQAIRWLQVLVDHPDEWISGTDLGKFDAELIGARPDRLLKTLPVTIRQLIESTSGKGSRIRLA